MASHTLGPWQELPWFLTTTPEPKPQLLRRPRLLHALEAQVLQSPVTLVCAPSGFGKTVLVADWARSRAHTQWVSAVRSTDTEMLIRGALLAAFPPAARARFTNIDPEEPSPGILDALAELPDPLVIVIDDAHLLDPTALRALALEEAMLRSGMIRFVLIGQSALTAQYALELATGAARAIGADQIALSEPETTELVALTSANPPAEQAWTAALFQRTGGWAIAVLLAARARDAAASGGAEPSPDFGGGAADPSLTEYIQAAVLGPLSPDLAEFILVATTCTRLDGWLAEQLTGRADGAELLERCVTQGLFLDRVETHAGKVMYRWHDMFARHCQLLLSRQDPERARQLHRDAAELLAVAFPTEGIEHALHANAPEVAARIITSSWLRLILEGQATTLDSLCARLPAPWKDRPEVLHIRACCLDLSGENHTAALLRERAHQLTHAAASEPGAASPELAYVQSFADVLLTPDPEQKAVAADTAYQLLTARGTADADPYALFVLGWAELRLRRDPFRAIEVLTSTWQQALRTDNPVVALKAQENATFANAYAGDFAQAEQLLASLGENHPQAHTDWERYDGGLRGLTQGYIEYWRGNFRAALEHCDQTLAEGGTSTSFLGLANVYRVLSITALGDEQLYLSAERTLEEIPEYDKHGVPWGAYRRMAAARLLEVQGRLVEARKVADPLLNRSRIPVTHALLADFYRRIEQPALAFLTLSKIKPRERPRYARVSSLVSFSALKFSSGDEEAAHHTLGRALEYASQDQVLAPFLIPDPQLGLLLDAHARSGTVHEALLAEIFARRDRAAGVEHTSKLTRREHELLGFLRTTMTAQEIADELHLSLATVKTHQRTLYRKLGVNSRREALRATPHHRPPAPDA